MSIQPAWRETFLFFDLPIVVEPSQGQLSSDAGLLPVREFDERLHFTEQFAQALHDPRAPAQIDHSFLQMVRGRVFGILAGYEDQNDHDTLRHDPVFKLLAGRSSEGAELASQPTLSRFENMIAIPSLFRLRDVFVDQFIASFATPPQHLTFDLDAVDDPTQGHQQLSSFHGYFDQYQYFPTFITSADTDQSVMPSLRPGAVHAALGADDDLEYLVRRLRQQWPGVRILVRGDAGYGVPWMYAVCERLDIAYSFGLATNAVLKAHSEALPDAAVQKFTETKTSRRLFDAFWYQAESWPAPRWVIVKAEANAQGTNPRFIVTNRPGAVVVPEAAYGDYARRGESENRNTEFKCDLAMDRTSDHRFVANFFRLYLHAAAHNLLVPLRRVIADPPASASGEVPVDALTGEDRQQHFRTRRQRDPLGEGQPCTWRSLLIGVAAGIIVSTRRVVVRPAASWPHLCWYRHVCQRLADVGISTA